MEHAEPGRDLFTSGDDTYDFFLLRSATVDIVRDATVIEPERVIYRGGPGDFLGELNLLTGQHSACRPTSSRSPETKNSWTPTALVDGAAHAGRDAHLTLRSPDGSPGEPKNLL
ncbi:cyclic nucleotide-binding domain-containing protein [Streptomyces sp. NPDC058457]|uniref:cyclic nucleotide-binding domain-containing protein n=1 Tax=Streptomyces sp. NPDC058457 TaxID=3346507 RepID=UPI003653349D